MTDRLEPGTPEYDEAWRLFPDRIVRQLTPAERCDPAKNPMHPMADSHAPGERLRRQIDPGSTSRRRRRALF
jgi:hypothetical protein